MKTVRESTTLYNSLGSHNPYWRLTEGGDVLRFSTTEATESDRTLQLSAEQAARIREVTVITSSLMMSLAVDESDFFVHLVGRKINKREWVGNASAWHDTPAVARDLLHGLSSAEQVASEAHSAIVILGSRGNVQRFNRLCEDYTGLKEHDVTGQSVFKLSMSRREAVVPRRNNRVSLRSGDAYEVELWIPTRKGQRPSLFRNKFAHSGSSKSEIFLICFGTDTIEERRAQERPRVLANIDNITGLPNRNAMQDLIDHAINRADNNKVGVVYLDLDNFKKVNDAYGYLFGDQLSCDVSLTILSCLEHDQVLARPGRDKFLVLASNISQSALEAMASRILIRLWLPFCTGLIEAYTSCLVGIALSPEHGSDSTAIIRHADTVIYTTKEGGRGQFRAFTPEMNQRISEYLWLDINLRKALENDQLVTHYQPKIIWRGEARSLETPVRWQSPERGLIPPLDSIFYVEGSRLVVPLGRWVILDIVRQMAKWRDKGIDL